MNRSLFLTIPISMLLLICAPAYGQRHNRTRGKTRTQTPQLPMPYPNIDPADYKDRIPTCSLTLEQAPIIRGFRLGMSVDEVAQRFRITDGSTVSQQVTYWKTHAPRYGTFAVEAFGEWLDSSGAAKDLHILRFSFVDGHLFELYFDYSDSVKWNNIRQFVDAVSPALKINERWSMPDTKKASLDCGSFKLEARLSHFGDVDLTLTDNAGKQEAVKRKEEAGRRKQAEEEKQRRDFKP